MQQLSSPYSAESSAACSAAQDAQQGSSQWALEIRKRTGSLETFRHPLPWSSVMALFSPLIFVVYPLRTDLLTAVNVFSFQADWGQRMPW